MGKNWSQEFIGYMEKIVSHHSYAGIPFVRDSEEKKYLGLQLKK